MQSQKGGWRSRVYLAAGAWILTFALTLALWGLLAPQANADVGAPLPGTVGRVATYTYLPATAAMTGTTYTDAPLTTAGGVDVSRISEWHAVDVFVSADADASAQMTVTAQFSPDRERWADADYTYVAQSGNMTDVVTALVVQPYRLIFTADGIDYVRVPLAGEYLRFKIERTGTVTATIVATLRND